MNLHIRNLSSEDPEVISAAFTRIGWNKPVANYRRYLEEQNTGEREILVALVDGVFAGYVTIHWESDYEAFRTSQIPEVEDFNVLPDFRRQGIGTALMDKAEALIAERSDFAGIGVGLYPDYGNAQKLYVLRGYLPDGKGIAYARKTLKPLASTIVDDDLALFFTKHLK